MYVLAPNQTVKKYPYSIGDLRKDNPQTSFPKNPSDQMLASWDVFPVVDPGQPTHDPMTQTVDEFPPAFVVSKNRWERQWAVRPATAQEIADRQSALIEDCTERTQQRLDEFAKTKNYDGILSACTYATSPTAIFATEGQYCVAQRDATWAKLYEILAEVQAGTRPMPTGYADIEAELPVLEWPAN